MSEQLPLPASWARGFGLATQRDPVEAKEHIARDRLEAKAQIHDLLFIICRRYEIPYKEVVRAMGSVEDALSDLTYDLECELDDEIENARDIY